MLAALVAVALLAMGCAVPPGSPATSAGASRYGELRPDTGFTYGPDPTQRADVYLPRSGGNRGVIVMVHGGAFRAGSPQQFALYGGLLLRQTQRGFAVVNAGYRLVDAEGANRFPAAVQDVAEVVRHVRRHGRSLGLDTSTVVVAGHSSGGTLAALVGLAGNDSDPLRGPVPRVDGWVSISGVGRMRHDGLLGLLSQLWLGPDRGAARMAAASAVAAWDAQDPPGYLIHGSADPLVPLSQAHDLALAGAAVGQRPWLDTVTHPDCNGHYPVCAENAPAFDLWLDRVVARTL